MQIDDKEYILLRNFFHATTDYRLNHDMKSAESIEIYISMYEKYLQLNNLTDNEEMKKFLLALKRSLLRAKKRKKTIEDSVYNMSRPLGKTYRHCGNDVIDKWVAEVSVIRIVDRATIVALNKAIEPKIRQNALERKLSYEEAKDKIVG